jgi:hypothetical protein
MAGGWHLEQMLAGQGLWVVQPLRIWQEMSSSAAYLPLRK